MALLSSPSQLASCSGILRITRGNLRLIDRLMMQVEHILTANEMTVVTKEVVETARENLIIGPG
jgi:hypothetical protein